MGCRSSQPKEQPAQQQQQPPPLPQREGVPEAVSSYLRLVNEANEPMARRMLEDWSVFVSALTTYFNTEDNSEIAAFALRGTESWLLGNGEAVPYEHRTADAVGKSFLAFLRHDLASRGWGGKFDYGVSGQTDQGYLKVAVAVECITAKTSALHIANFDRKINYVTA